MVQENFWDGVSLLCSEIPGEYSRDVKLIYKHVCCFYQYFIFLHFFLFLVRPLYHIW